jgi:hypothetical protein
LKRRERKKIGRRLFQEVHRHVKMGVVCVCLLGIPSLSWDGGEKKRCVHPFPFVEIEKILLLLSLLMAFPANEKKERNMLIKDFIFLSR